MENFTLFDGGVAAILFISAVLAYSRGFVREILSIAGWIGAGVVAFYFSPQVVPLVQEIPVLNDIIGDNCELGILAAFAGVFAIALVVIALFTPLISGAGRHRVRDPETGVVVKVDLLLGEGAVTACSRL